MESEDDTNFDFICGPDCIEATFTPIPCAKCKNIATTFFKSIQIRYMIRFFRETSSIYCVVCKSLLHEHYAEKNYDLRNLEKMRLETVQNRCMNSPAYKNIVSTHEHAYWTRFQDINPNSRQEVRMLMCDECKKIIEVQSLGCFYPPNEIGSINQSKIHYQTHYYIPRYT